MKKLLIALLTILMVLSMASCDVLPDNIKDQIDAILGNTQGTPDDGNGEHVHEFILSEKDCKAPSCTKDGAEVKICACGEKQTTAIPATGHGEMILIYSMTNCTTEGKARYKCSVCGSAKTVVLEPTGHNYAEDTETSRLKVCQNETCESFILTEGNGKYAESLKFDFDKDDEEAITALYEEVLAAVTSAPAYDPELHVYTEVGELYDAF